MNTPLDSIRNILPVHVRNRVDGLMEAADIFASMKSPSVMRAIAPSAVRGLLFSAGKHSDTSDMPASHSAHFDWAYPHDHPEMLELYERAKLGQWNGSDLPWHSACRMQRL